jgi:hypothetical protein
MNVSIAKAVYMVAELRPMVGDVLGKGSACVQRRIKQSERRTKTIVDVSPIANLQNVLHILLGLKSIPEHGHVAATAPPCDRY